MAMENGEVAAAFSSDALKVMILATTNLLQKNIELASDVLKYSSNSLKTVSE